MAPESFFLCAQNSRDLLPADLTAVPQTLQLKRGKKASRKKSREGEVRGEGRDIYAATYFLRFSARFSAQIVASFVTDETKLYTYTVSQKPDPCNIFK